MYFFVKRLSSMTNIQPRRSQHDRMTNLYHMHNLQFKFNKTFVELTLELLSKRELFDWFSTFIVIGVGDLKFSLL